MEHLWSQAAANSGNPSQPLPRASGLTKPLDSRSQRRATDSLCMAVLWILVLLLLLFAIVGGVAVNHWLFVILVIALVLLLIGVF
jgi:hypothetical protein